MRGAYREAETAWITKHPGLERFEERDHESSRTPQTLRFGMLAACLGACPPPRAWG